MPTKDSGKPTSRRRKGSESTNQTSRTGKATPSSSQKPAPRASRQRASRAGGPPPAPSTTPAAPREPVAENPHEGVPGAFAEPSMPGQPVEPAAQPIAPQPAAAAEQPGAPQSMPQEPPSEAAAEAERAAAHAGTFEPNELEIAAPQPERDGLPDEAEVGVLPGDGPPRRRDRRGAGTNALGVFIERQFANPTSPAHSYSDLERHSRISREALSRYVTARADRRRSPTIDTLVAIADALHVSLEAVARAAAASVKGIIPPPEDVQRAREETLGTLVAALSDEQFSAVVELLRQMRPLSSE